ncbi:amino acid adenylation domain-containing protein [Paenibacillus popilliae]|uniref:Amino acid adenylation domain-containing protein n=1 Tax=Paenibacillus popilliae TaxID=78057 RepID=A0ABY3AIV0_PAEPP|nr:amino acid adenylation domain-containing protein [Paenibacillus sp. SDF0028]TQR41752.1 amino acid adenylation domain-containing protein [Paenibacillus sp. SDF0028]
MVGNTNISSNMQGEIYLLSFIATALKYSSEPNICLRYQLCGQPNPSRLKILRTVAETWTLSDDIDSLFALNNEEVETAAQEKNVFNILFLIGNEDDINNKCNEMSNTHLKLMVNESTGICKFSINNDYFIVDILNELNITYQNILKEITKSPTSELKQFMELFPNEQKKIDEVFNNNSMDWGDKLNYSFSHLFEEQVSKTPDSIALSWRNERINYRELNRLSNYIADQLRSHGVEHQMRVVVISQRSIDFVAIILAIWKIGAIYVPIDPEYPSGRIEGILEDCNPHVVIYDNKQNCFESYKVIYTQDLINKEHKNYSGKITQDLKSSELLAYIIYTSGSTGKPKGVMIEHKGMINHLLSKVKDLEITGVSRVAQNASQSFDISIWQIFSALAVGGQTVIYENEVILQLNRFLDSIENDNVSIIEFVPSYLNVLLKWIEKKPRKLEKLKYVLVTGETLKASLVEKWFNKFPETPLINAYGPTEASDDITHEFMYSSSDNRISIGKPIYNMKIYIVNDENKLCPIGVKGEIIVSGEGVGRGYWNNVDKTNDSFKYLNITSDDQPTRYYFTGDIGCWTDEGKILCFGRRDEQVKVRGYRIELQEIDHFIEQVQGIENSVTIAFDNENENKRLVTFIVCKAQTQSIKKEITDYLHQNLPYYMVPEEYYILETLPKTPNGKIDKKQLISIIESEEQAWKIRL